MCVVIIGVRKMPYMIERTIEPPEDKVFCQCEKCGGDIYIGEDYFDFDGDIVCEDCYGSYVKEHFRRCAG